MRRYLLTVIILLLAASRSVSLAQSEPPTLSLPELEPIMVNNAGRVEELVTLETGEVFSLAWSPDGNILAVNRFDDVRLYDVRQLDSPPRLIQAEFVRAIAFSPDGSQLATAGLTKNIQLWDVESGEEVATFEGHENGINDIAFSPDGSLLASVDGDLVQQGESSDFWPTEHNTLRMWDLNSGGQLAVMHGSGPNIINAVAFDPGGNIVVIADDIQVVRGWDVETLLELAVTDEDTASIELIDVASSLIGSLGGIYRLAFSPDGNILAACGTSGSGLSGFVWLWNLETGEDTGIYESYDHILDVSFNADSTVLAFVEPRGVLHLWDIEAALEIAALEGNEDALVSAAFSPDGTLIATGNREGTVRLWGVPAA
jgi:WD40 repeat protein